MPTPARSATAEIGAVGSATNTARAASRISWSLRAAWTRRPLRRGPVCTCAVYPQNETFRSAVVEVGLGSTCDRRLAQPFVHLEHRRVVEFAVPIGDQRVEVLSREGSHRRGYGEAPRHLKDD